MWLPTFILLGLLSGVSSFTSITPAFLKETTDTKILGYVFTGRLKGYYSYIEYLEVCSKLKTNFPFAVAEVRSIGKGYVTGEIFIVKLALSESFDFDTNRVKINSEDLASIRRRPNILVVSYMQADEGASIMQCFYSLYYLLHGIVNMRSDIVTLLKKQSMTFACVLNAEQLDQIEQIFKESPVDLIATRIKNYRREGDCAEEFKGVNLKYNFAADNSSRACDLMYRGPDARSEPEIKALMAYIEDPASMISSVLVLGNGNRSIDLSSWAYSAQSSVDRSTIQSFTKIFNELKKTKLKDSSYSLASASMEGQLKENIINNIDSGNNRFGISLNTVQRGPSMANMFVPITQLQSEATIVKDIIIRAACIQTGCVLPEFYSLATNVCLVKATAPLCSKDNIKLLKDRLYGLSFSLLNIGLRTHSASKYSIVLQASAQLVMLATVNFTAAARTSGNTSVSFQTTQAGELVYSTVDVVDKDVDYQQSSHTYLFEIPAIETNQKVDLVALVDFGTETRGLVSVGLATTGGAPRDIFFAEETLSNLIVPQKADDIIEAVVLVAKPRRVGFGQRKIQYIVFFTYLGVTGSLAIVWAVWYSIRLLRKPKNRGLSGKQVSTSPKDL